MACAIVLETKKSEGKISSEIQAARAFIFPSKIDLLNVRETQKKKEQNVFPYSILI